MSEDGYSSVARIVKTHGLKGEVAVATSIAAPFSVLLGTPVWFVPPPRAVRSATISNVRPGPKGPLILFSGIEDVNAAATLVGCDMLVRTGDVPAAVLSQEEDAVDYCGFKVTDVQRGLIGTITETIITGANDVWVVDGAFGEVLIPVIDDVVTTVDEDAGTIEVSLLDGLLP